MREQPKYLEQKINYKFQDDKLLIKAITHRSYSGSNNERLEFLGDALLGFIIGEALYNKFPKATEGQLTRLRSDLVKKDMLIKIAEEFEINKYILLGEGELRSGGLQRRSILADSIEAIIAGIYLDSDFYVCKQVVLNWYNNKLDNMNLDLVSKDSKTILQEWLQARNYDLPIYSIILEQGTPHDKEFEVECRVNSLNIITNGRAENRRKAEQVAAKFAMNIIIDEKTKK